MACRKATASLVPFFALAGTVVGSILWGVIADIYGRKASILLSAVMFVGTSICGAMPSLDWNVGMCFMMGAAAGGMLPVTYALLAEMMPSRHRGWALVLVGGLGAVGGYFAASGLSALLQPIFGWRILWLLNLPTGLSLVLLGGLIPESAKFLLARGRREEAQAGDGALRLAGAQGARIAEAGRARPRAVGRADRPRPSSASSSRSASPRSAWGLINFGLLLWLPADLVAKGYSMARVEQAARRIRADRLPDGVRRRLSVQPLEHEMVAGRARSRSRSPACRRAAARVRRHRQPGASGRSADRRHQRHHRDAPALCGGKLPAAHARPGDRLGRRLHQGGRHVRAIPRHPRAGAGARRRFADHHGPDRVALSWSPGSARRRAAATFATSIPTRIRSRRPASSSLPPANLLAIAQLDVRLTHHPLGEGRELFSDGGVAATKAILELVEVHSGLNVVDRYGA